MIRSRSTVLRTTEQSTLFDFENDTRYLADPEAHEE